MAAALLAKILPFDLFETRRLAGAAVGLIGLFATWRIGRRVGGPLAGLLALILLATCPLYYGHMFINPKDAPFAVAMAVFLLGLVRLLEEYPKPSAATLVIVGLGFGLSIGSRIMAGFGVIVAVLSIGLLVADREPRTDGLRAALVSAPPASARADPGGRPRLCGDGAGLALGRRASAQSASRHRDLLALLREAVARALRRRADHAARHAAQLCAGADGIEAAGDLLAARLRGRRRRAGRRVPQRAARRAPARCCSPWRSPPCCRSRSR